MPAEPRNPERREKAERETPFSAPILLVVDASDTVVKAARRAAEVAAAFKTRIVAVSVVDTETLEHLLRHNILVKDEMEEFKHDLGESAKSYLRMASATAQELGVPCEEVLLHGSWHQSVIAKRREIGAGLVVVGGFRYTMIRRDIVGKAKQLIIDEVQCPVLIVR